MQREILQLNCCVGGLYIYISVLVFTNTKTLMEGEIKYTRSTRKRGFPGEVLSKTSLSCNSSRATTEQSAIFAFSVLGLGPVYNLILNTFGPDQILPYSPYSTYN